MRNVVKVYLKIGSFVNFRILLVKRSDLQSVMVISKVTIY